MKNNITQQNNSNQNNNNQNICYTENSINENNCNNNENSYVGYNKGMYSDTNVNVHVLNTMPNKLNNDNMNSESYQKSKHSRRNSNVSSSQNFDGNNHLKYIHKFLRFEINKNQIGNKAKLNEEVYPKWWADPSGIGPIKNKNVFY